MAGGADDEVDDVLTSEFYLTQVRAKEEFDAANIRPDCQRHVRFGRPDLGLAFAAMAQTAETAGEDRVAVLVCGPASMVSAARALCINMSNAKVCFEFHCEEFEF